MASGKMFETLSLTILGIVFSLVLTIFIFISLFSARSNARNMLQQIVNEAVRKGAAKDEGKTVIFTGSFGDWKRFCTRHNRPWESVIFPVCLLPRIPLLRLPSYLWIFF